MTNANPYRYGSGNGVSLKSFKFAPGVAARIEALGKLNDRRLTANQNGDIAELEAVAHEYECLKQPCTAMAKEIRIALSVRKNAAKLQEEERTE